MKRTEGEEAIEDQPQHRILGLRCIASVISWNAVCCELHITEENNALKHHFENINSKNLVTSPGYASSCRDKGKACHYKVESLC